MKGCRQRSLGVSVVLVQHLFELVAVIGKLEYGHVLFGSVIVPVAGKCWGTVGYLTLKSWTQQELTSLWISQWEVITSKYIIKSECLHAFF